MTNTEAKAIIEANAVPIFPLQIVYQDWLTAIHMAEEALEKPKWNKTSEVKPTEEKQYLCCSIYTDKPFFKVLAWSNDLYEVDSFEFDEGESGFYTHDSECGYLEAFCDYWQEIDWSDEE